MNTRIIKQAIIATSLLIGVASADIPGLFVVQQASVSDPLLQTLLYPATKISEFGDGDIQSVGDFDLDGVEDIITSSRKSFQDSGSLVLLSLSSSGSVKSSSTYSTRNPAFSGFLDSYMKGVENFGDGLAVLSKFSTSQNCSQLIVSSRVIKRIYGITLCRESGSTPSLTVSSVIDSTNDALKGLPFLKPQIASTMAVIDTIASTGEYVVALGVKTASWATSTGTKTNVGAVILLAVKPGASWSWRRLSVLPSSLDDVSDPLYGEVNTSSSFGSSIAKIRVNGKNGFAVLASSDTLGGKKVGRIHEFTLNSSFQVSTHAVLPGTIDLGTTGLPISIASNDFNHDGIPDLAVGYALSQSTGGDQQVGGYSVNILDGSGQVAKSQFFAGSINGIIASAEMRPYTKIGTKLSAIDFDHDGQVDIIAGAIGAAEATTTQQIPGSLWFFRMKSTPWLHQPASVVGLSQQQWVSTRISDYLTGNQLKCEFTPPDPLLAECTFASDLLTCRDKNHNGTTVARIICRDSGNIPATDHFYDTLDFTLKITLVDSLPQAKQSLPLIGLREDQPDTSVLAFSNYFRDPENGPLSYTIMKIGSASFAYLDTAYVISGSLRIKALPLRFGLCSLSVKVTDTAGGYRIDTLRVQIAHKNHAPIAKDDTITARESTPISIPVMANDVDPDKDPLSITIVARSVHGSTIVSGANKNEILFKPDSFYLGKDSVQYVLKDDSTSVTAWLRINVVKTAMPPRVVRPLPADLTILESADTVRVSFDSLFYSGDYGFNVPVLPLDQGCDYIAKTILDRVSRTILIVPIPYKSGECRIRVWQSATKDSITSAMMLHITAVPNPYQFWTDTLYLEAVKNSKTVYQLKDSIDKDDDTLEYYFLDNPAPVWIQINRSSLVFSPDKASTDLAFTIATRKKAKAGSQSNPATDSLVVIVQVSNTSIHGRKLGSLQMKYQSSSHLLTFQGGNQPFTIDVLQPNGRYVGSLYGNASEVVSLPVPTSSGMLYLRVLDGHRKSTYPILLTP